MLVDETGQVTVAWINSQDRMRAQIEIALEAGAPPALVKKLRSGDTILTCPTPAGFYEAHHVYDWHRHVLPCQEIRGNALWKVAIQQDNSLNLAPVSLRQYRKALARNGGA